MDLWQIEDSLIRHGYSIIAGVDEAGRGPLAGPVCAAAVILPPHIDIPDLNDSKKLTQNKREKLYEIIKEKSIAWSCSFASHFEVDELNILNATYLAMNRAISSLKVIPEISIIDGNRATGVEHNNICVVKGDSISASVAAASIIAKVTRDRYMVELSKRYPQYGFERHKGYGTKLHYEMLKKFGPTPEHRRTFLRKIH